MKKKKRNNIKGFTLIELLAVIVILAVIALIAVPQVLKILNKSRLSAAEDSVYGIVKSAETYVSNFMLKNSGSIPSEDLVFNCSSDGCTLQNIDSLSSYELDGLEELEFKGTKPKNGVVVIRNNGSDIVANNLVINGFRCQSVNGEAICFDKKEGPTSEIPTTVGYTGVLRIVYLDPTDLAKTCDASNSVSTKGTKEGCMKWYAYSDDGTNYTMILDHNTTVHVAWNSSGDNSSIGEIETQLLSDVVGWNSSLNPRLITAQEVANITKYKDWTNKNSNWFFFETLTWIGPEPWPQPSKYGWLFDRTNSNCITSGCLNNEPGVVGYWTSTPVSDNIKLAWYVNYQGTLYRLDVDYMDRYGVRPVITVPKNKIS